MKLWSRHHQLKVSLTCSRSFLYLYELWYISIQDRQVSLGWPCWSILNSVHPAIMVAMDTVSHISDDLSGIVYKLLTAFYGITECKKRLKSLLFLIRFTNVCLFVCLFVSIVLSTLLLESLFRIWTPWNSYFYTGMNRKFVKSSKIEHFGHPIYKFWLRPCC